MNLKVKYIDEDHLDDDDFKNVSSYDINNQARLLVIHRYNAEDIYINIDTVRKFCAYERGN